MPSPADTTVHGMGRLTVAALRVVLVIVLAGTAVIQVAMVWVLVSGSDTEPATAALTGMRVITVLGMVAAQAIAVSVWQLVTMVRRGALFSQRAFRWLDITTAAIVAVALLWFAVTTINAPGQSDDPGVTVIMAGIGVAILGVALIVRILRLLLTQVVSGQRGA